MSFLNLRGEPLTLSCAQIFCREGENAEREALRGPGHPLLRSQGKSMVPRWEAETKLCARKAQREGVGGEAAPYRTLGLLFCRPLSPLPWFSACRAFCHPQAHVEEQDRLYKEEMVCRPDCLCSRPILDPRPMDQPRPCTPTIA